MLHSKSKLKGQQLLLLSVISRAATQNKQKMAPCMSKSDHPSDDNLNGGAGALIFRGLFAAWPVSHWG